MIKNTNTEDAPDNIEELDGDANWGILELPMTKLEVLLEAHRPKWRAYRESGPRHMRQVEGTVMKLSF